MKIVFVHGHMFNSYTWSRAHRELKKQGIDLELFSQLQSGQAVIEFLNNKKVNIFIGSLYHDLPLYNEIIASAKCVEKRVGIARDMPEKFSTFSKEQINTFNIYLDKISLENYINGIRYLANIVNSSFDYKPPKTIQTCMIYHPDAGDLFSTVNEYHIWYLSRFPPGGTNATIDVVLGIVSYYGQITENNHDDIDLMIKTIESHGMTPLCVCFDGIKDATCPMEQRYPWLEYFKRPLPFNNKKISALVNLMAGRLLSKADDAFVLEKLNVPIFQMIRLYRQSPEEWAEDPGGLGKGSFGLVYGLSQPEMAGIIEPSMAAGSIRESISGMDLDTRRYVPISERIDHLCSRLLRWVKLQTLANHEKRLTIILNNNPCKGVEATLGLAAGLDTFESLSKFIQALKDAGYNTGDAPSSGTELLNQFTTKKAFSEFRWTTVDEIIKKNGVIHFMGEKEYKEWFDTLGKNTRNKIIKDWENFPGKGMAWKRDGKDLLLITGLEFGNIKIIIQPKRGCYGAKCDGEVCRILHDPQLSPPHHWLATYLYIQKTSDAMIHFGTHGALEFLPGKQAALSKECFPEISLGDLPNFYVYVMDVPGDAIVAKRRGRAVIIDHLTPVTTPAPVGDDILKLEQLAGEYKVAKDNKELQRKALIKGQMRLLMSKCNLFGKTEFDDFEEQIQVLSRRIEQIKRTLSPSGMHILGSHPDIKGVAAMLTTILMKKDDKQPELEQIAALTQSNTKIVFDNAQSVIQLIIEDNIYVSPNSDIKTLGTDFIDWCKKLAKKIFMGTREIPQLLKALNGEYIEPGLSGSLGLGKTQALPTGRNIFATDVSALPTHTAWKVGQILADNLLAKHMKEENKFPQSVGISLWSIDAFKSDGEVFCQILYLMGMRPVWSANQKVSSIEPVPLDQLSIMVDNKKICPRPRIDVIIQTSGILRDMVPHFADLMDEAAVMAAGLDEPDELNFIKKHTNEQMAELKDELKDQLSKKELFRLASFRVFSSPPGTHGIGVGLALDASAWNDEKDLTETYINWGGVAYGSLKPKEMPDNINQQAHNLYARNLKNIDVTYMRQYSPEYDLVNSGCYASYLGGMSNAVETIGKKPVKIYWADTNAVGDLSVRDLKNDIEISVNAHLFNTHWIKTRQEHGYKGASSVASQVNNLFKWSATTKKVDKWVFDEVVKTYIQNFQNLEWLRQDNPYALEELTRRLLEASSRGLWHADPDLLEDVQQAALLVEGDMEETMGDVKDEFQGSRVDVITSRDVDKWQPKFKL